MTSLALNQLLDHNDHLTGDEISQNVCIPVKLVNQWHGVITIRCTRSRGPRGFFCLHDFRRGPVNVAVITLAQ